MEAVSTENVEVSDAALAESNSTKVADESPPALAGENETMTGMPYQQPNASTMTTTPRSALQDNIARKGKNAYYFAHANKPQGPEWDGKEEPRLLSRSSGGLDDITGSKDKAALFRSSSSFDYSKSNITAYSFLDDGPVIKIYLTGLEGIGEQCTDSDIDIQYTERSFCITINNYCRNAADSTISSQSSPQVLSFSRLSGAISNASFRIKKDKIIVTLTKHENENNKEWHTIHEKGKPDHEVV